MEPQKPARSGVIGELLTEGYRFEFFQAVRLLELWAPDRSPVGHDKAPQDESVRFGAHPSVEFPASQVYDVAAVPDSPKPPSMTVTFFGLMGPLGALPQHYTEAVIERLARKDRTLLEFFNLFNHRLLSLFYRAWEKYQFWVASERALIQERRVGHTGEEHHRAFVLNERPHLDPIGQILLDVCGLGTAATRYVVSQRDRLEPRTEIDDQTWRFYAGLLSQRHRSASSLEGMLADHFGLPVRVSPLCGRWLQLEREDRTRLARGGNTALGRETVAGRKVWEVQGKFRLQVGPLKYDPFCSLLPIGSAHRPMIQLTRFYAGQHLDFDIALHLLTKEIPELRCGVRDGIGPRLGWNTWLKSRDFVVETASVVLRSYDAQCE
jgi:type VI secretion system protein ImpH